MRDLFSVCLHMLSLSRVLAGEISTKDDDRGSMMLAVLDSVQAVMTGQTQYDRRQFQAIVHSLIDFDPQLYHSQENGWRGMLAYYQAGGGVGDRWGGNPSRFMERNTTKLLLPNSQNLLVFEPCNFASNIAYYHMNIALARYNQWVLPQSVVRGLAQASASLALGSAFWHGSHTILGGETDTGMIAVMAYIMHQASLEHLPKHIKTSILTDLKTEKRFLTGVEVAQVVTDMYRTEPSSSWLHIFTSLDIPSYETTFSALIVSLLTLVFPEPVIKPAASTLSDLFGVDAPTKKFILESYIPSVRAAFSKIKLTVMERLDILLSTIGTVKKLVYAFLFQEDTFNIDFLKSPLAVQIGATFQPILNTKTNLPSSLPDLSPRLSSGQGLYPGDTWCRTSQPHSLWHAQSAAGLIDFFLLVDKMVKILYF